MSGVSKVAVSCLRLAMRRARAEGDIVIGESPVR
jgi:hypothetical protein